MYSIISLKQKTELQIWNKNQDLAPTWRNLSISEGNNGDFQTLKRSGHMLSRQPLAARSRSQGKRPWVHRHGGGCERDGYGGFAHFFVRPLTGMILYPTKMIVHLFQLVKQATRCGSNSSARSVQVWKKICYCTKAVYFMVRICRCVHT